ncbi:MAG: hypothetical protein JXQ76_13445 [Campylobacterales bacterium]|nr:hypothetical protein [Campylobacterales bacterium]
MDFVVVDTEGKELLKEIAIIDSSGTLLYEAFVEDNLKEVLEHIEPILAEHLIVAHSASHDKKVLTQSFQSIGKTIEFKTLCTYQKAKKLRPNLHPHALETLSKALHLKYQEAFFSTDLAHKASYDAYFTYLLYQKLLEIEQSLENAQKYNPFSSSKVDTPFQNHFDFPKLYADEFTHLLSLIDEVKSDSNHQSKTALVLGQAGDGKTHLMMRFLNAVSHTNRFLFIPKPNSAKRILFHTYTKILESFIQTIDGSAYSQLEYLLAKSFAAIIIPRSQNSKAIEALKSNHLNIYERFGQEGSDTRRRIWNTLEKLMINWYQGVYGNDLISINLLKALVKYTYYKDAAKKDIVISFLSGKDLDEEVLESVDLAPWSEIDIEEFALKAIQLFGRLSLFDEPLIISFDQLEAMSSDKPLLLEFGEKIKELITHTPNALIILNLFPNRWSEYEALFDGSIIDLLGKNKIYLQRPSNALLKELLQSKALSHKIELDDIFEDRLIYNDILNHSSIRRVLNRASDYFKLYIHDIPLPKDSQPTLQEQVAALLKRIEHLEKLNHIEHKPTIQIDFDIDSYIEKVYNQKYKEYDKKSIIDDKNDLDRLKYILNSIKELYHFKIDFFKTKKVMPEHIIIQTDKFNYVVGFLHLEGRLFVNRIKHFNHFVATQPHYYFRLFRDARESEIRGKISNEEIEKLNNHPQGRFITMDKEHRVIFETLYQLITDLKSKDIEIKLEDLMHNLMHKYSDFWLCKLLNPKCNRK